MLITTHLDSQRKSDPEPEILSVVYTGNRIQSDGRNTLGIVEKTTVGKDNKIIMRGS